MLSASLLPKAESLLAATPITRTGTLPSSSTSPTGEGVFGNRVLRVLSSITATWSRRLTWSASKAVPWAIFTPLTRKYCAPAPITVAEASTLR